MFVTKKSGELEEFQAEKIASGCQKAGASEETAKKVADIISKKAKDKISTKEIGDMVIDELKKLDEKAAKEFEQYFRSH